MNRYILLLLISVLTHCITGFKGVNYESINKKPEKTLKKLSYRVFGSMGSPSAIERVLRNDSYFLDSMSADIRPVKGAYVEVSIRQVNPPPATIAWGYFSYATLFIIPSWDNEYGYDISYDTYIDGEKVKQNDYQIKRSTYLSVFLLPLSWISLTRPGEEEAFAHSAHKYLSENQDFFQKQQIP